MNKQHNIKLPKNSELCRREYSLSYIDTSPSELIHKSMDDYLIIGLINYLNIEKTLVKKISQFKNTRGIVRRVQMQQYIIEAFEKEFIIAGGTISWNEREMALANGKFILQKHGLCEEKKDYEEIVIINGEQLSYGHLVSLAWYSFILATFAKEVGVIARVARKDSIGIFLDLLPGDNQNYTRNLNVVRFIIRKTELDDFFNDALELNSLKQIGFGYALKNNSTKTIKNELEYTLIDWIVQSFNSLVLYEKRIENKESEFYQLSTLARYLVQNKLFTIGGALILTN